MIGEDAAENLREEIRRSWQRARLSGLRPEDSLDDLAIEDVNHRSRLIEAAAPVLDRLAADLDETGFCVLLADRDARLVDLRFGQRQLSDRMADDGAVLGRRFLEQTTGTNSLATVYETHRPLRVQGEEHFIYAMKKFTCYGMPLIHPVTRRLEGVLDITCLNADDTPLLAPTLRRAVDDVQGRLLERSRHREQSLLAEFQDTVARHRDQAIMAIADDLALSNSEALRVLDPVDQAVFRALIRDAKPGGATNTSVTLSSGVKARLDWSFVDSGGAIIRVHPSESSGVPADFAPSPRRVRRSALFRGESGTGKSRAAKSFAPSATIIESDRLVEDTPANWLEQLRQAIGSSRAQGVIIEDVELLPPAVARRVRDLLLDSDASFALTQTIGGAESNPEVRQLVAIADELRELAPLRATPDLIPVLARELLADIDSAAAFNPAAVVELASRRWPGNLRELRQTIERASRRRNGAEVLTADLGHRSEDIAAAPLNPLARSQREAIQAALARHGANKSAAAEELGISRTTLYKRMKELGIVG